MLMNWRKLDKETIRKHIHELVNDLHLAAGLTYKHGWLVHHFPQLPKKYRLDGETGYEAFNREILDALDRIEEILEDL